MSKTHDFKTESKRLLDLMINSIYTHKEIFLRELISNASDAIDKRHYLSLTDESIPSSDDYHIYLDVNKEERTISIKDNGIGLTEEELINNLGTIAQSGSKQFIEALEEKKDLDIIGQFGVGFYSAFMVSKEVVVETRSPKSDQGYKWTSSGEESYAIEPLDKDEIGTTITLYLREDNEEKEEDYSTYLEEHTIKHLVKKYSDYVRYPIKMLEIVPSEKEEKEDTKELKTLNSMVPLWKKSKSELNDEDLNDFYKHKYNDFDDPLEVIHTKVEGLLEYTALLFIPKKAPYDFYSENYEKGLQLYSKGVFIEDKNKDLLPDYFKFVKGLVDSSDLSLNISREMLQHNRQLKKIASTLEKKIKNELEKMLKNDREKYIAFYDAYKTTLKYGIYDQYGMNKEKLQDLIMFKTTKSDDYITLSEYLERKPEAQKHIYYATGKTKQSIMNLPQMDLMKEKDYEVLLFTDDIDEFMVQMLNSYNDVSFKSIQQGESDLLNDEEKDALKSQEKQYKKLLKAIKKALDGKVKDVRLTGRLKESPVCLVSGEGLSLEMEKILKQMPNAEANMQADKVLEINPNHDLFNALKTVDEAHVQDYANLLYHQALLIEGYPIDDPTEFNNTMIKLMLEASKK